MVDVSSRDSSAAGAVILIVLTIVVVIWLLVIGLAGWLVFRFLRKQLSPAQLAPEGVAVRLFDAPPTSSWLDTFDHWLAKLEKVTGLDFTRTPNRLMAGALIICIGAALVVGVVVVLLTPIPPETGLGGLMILGALVGGLTGRRLGQPVVGWFMPSGSQGAMSTSDSFVLGEENKGNWS